MAEVIDIAAIAGRRPSAVLVAGPTASGKSALALELASSIDGVLVNADSMQVYRDLRVLTARPSVADEAAAPHRLYGHVPAAHAYSVAQWLADVAREIAAARTAGRMPIVVGGTGLYFKALTEGLSPIPEIPAAIRGHWRATGAAIGPAGLHRLLSQRDPETAAALSPTDTQRLVRALEVFDATGRGMAYWQRQPGMALIDAATTEALVVSPDRAALYERSDRRFRVMIETGALDEVRGLLALGLAAELPVMRALGVAPLARFVAGDLSLDAAIAAGQGDTRRYIKRQLTWLRRYMIAWKWIETKY